MSYLEARHGQYIPVSCIVGHTTSTYSTSPPSPSSSLEEDGDEGDGVAVYAPFYLAFHCSVCLRWKAGIDTVLFVPCRHVSCKGCYENIKKSNALCHMCRREITLVVVVDVPCYRGSSTSRRHTSRTIQNIYLHSRNDRLTVTFGSDREEEEEQAEAAGGDSLKIFATVRFSDRV